MYPSKRPVVIGPSKRIVGPTPASEREARTVLFSPLFLGAEAYARRPRGARACVGVYPRWLPVSSSQTQADGSTRAASVLHTRRATQSRSLAALVFFFASMPRP
jgi:hypothetical protein